MVDVNEQITNNFHQNVNYLQHHHRAVYEKLLAYENYMTTNQLNENFTLSLEDGNFDIINLQTNKHLYNKQSKQLIQVMLESVNFQKSENVFETYKILPKTEKTKGYDFVFDLFEKYGDKTKELKEIYKFIFFGTGLHLETIANKVSAKYYLIVEDNIELFRLSLFTTKYFELDSKAKLFFAVGSDKQEFEKIAQRFLDEAFYYNQYIKFFESVFHNEEKLQLFHTAVITQSHLNFFYGSILEQYTQPLSYLRNNYNFINLTSKTLIEYCKNKSVILVAPGPSLDKNIEFIKANHTKCIIVALSATLKSLELANIKPDIITHFDGFERSAVHFEKLENKEFIKDSILLLSAKTPKTVVSMFDKEKIFFFESGTNYKQGFGELSAFCAGSSTYLILLALRFKEVYLVGLDLALEQTTLKTHSEAYSYNLEASQDQETLNFRNSIIETEGNLRPTVKTTPNFSLSIKAINEITQGLKQNQQNVYNLNDGAKLIHTIPIKHFCELQINNIDKDIHTLYRTLQDSSANSLSKQEYAFLNAIYEHSVHVLNEIHKFDTKSYLCSEKFEEALINFKNDICLCNDKECEVLSLLLENYLRFVYGFIFDLFNTKNLELEIEPIKTALNKNLEEIVKDFSSHFKES